MDNQLLKDLSELPQRVAVLEERSESQGEQLKEISAMVKELSNKVTNEMMHRLSWSVTAIISTLTAIVAVLGTLLASRW
jgi:uncharacterized coiled-coil protein SlyX